MSRLRNELESWAQEPRHPIAGLASDVLDELDRLAAEVARLKEERDEAKKKVARYKQAVADQLHADMAEIVGQRDAAEQRTAEVIAAWLDRQYGSIGIHGRIAQNIRAGMWRKEATK